jgi:Methyltransferase domain
MVPRTNGDVAHDGLMETATRQAEHWDEVYGHGDTTRSWFQAQPGWSLRMLDLAGISPADSVIDVGGGSSPLAAALLARGHSDITVLDVSVVGIGAAQHRFGAAVQRVQWLVADVRNWRPARRYVVWHDRALFHFMTSDQDREAHLHARGSATSPERAICILATFALDGPPRCSPTGAPVRCRPACGHPRPELANDRRGSRITHHSRRHDAAIHLGRLHRQPSSA